MDRHGRRLGIKVRMPPFNFRARAQMLCSTAYDYSFGVKAAKLWNILPKRVNTDSTLESFKISPYEFMLYFPDKPPNSNSLLDRNAKRGRECA